MQQITLLDFLAECLEKNGNDVTVTRLSDGSGSCITLRKETSNQTLDITLDFNGHGTELKNVQGYVVTFESENHDKIF